MISYLWKSWSRRSVERSNLRRRDAFRRVRLGVEHLEARDCPSTNYSLANFSFESPILQPGVNGAPQTAAGTNNLYLGNNTITSWAVSGTNIASGVEAGLVREASAIPVTTGAQHGRIVMPAAAGAAQVTVTSASPTTIAAGTAYTFTIDLAGDAGFASSGNVATAGKNSINLLANVVTSGGTTATVIASTAIPNNLTSADDTLSVTVDSSTLPAADIGAGLTVQIAIGNTATAPPSVELDFDNARLVSSGDNSTTTSVTTSSATVTPGSPVTFTATVAANVAPASPAPTGTVQFFDNGTLLSDASSHNTFTLVANGGNTASTASITLSTLTTGGHEIKAVYTPAAVGETHGGSTGYVAENIQAAGALFTAGNLVVDTAGDGSSGVNSNSAPVYLDQYNTTAADQAPSANMILPLSTANGNNTLTIGGSSSSDGILQTSTDGRYLVLPGFDVTPGFGVVSTSATAAVPRDVALITNTGAADTSTVINDAFNATGFRSAASLDGQVIWTAGEDSSGGIRAVLDGNLNLNSVANIASSIPVSTGVATDFPSVGILTANGASQLYASAGAGYSGVASIGTGTPTLAGSGAENPLINNHGNNSSQFVYVAAGGGTPQAPANGDFLYIADTTPYNSNPSFLNTGGLQKWEDVLGTWQLQYSMMPSLSAGDFLAVTAVVADPSSANTFYVITAKDTNGSNYLYKIVDNGSYNSPPPTYTQLAVSPTNTLFHGVAFAPTAIGATAVNSIGLQSSSPSANYGTAVTFTATVKAATTPTGYITFRSADGNTIYGVVQLTPSTAANTAIASLTIPATTASAPFSELPLGTYNIVAVYGGDGTYAKNSASVAQTINALTTVAPTFTSAATATVTVDYSSQFQVSAIAPGDTTPIVYSLGNTAPAGVTINPTSGVLSVAPTVPAGTYNFFITATNDSATTQSPEFALDVVGSNVVPFTGGDLVLVQSGDGINVYQGGTGAQIFLDEVSPSAPAAADSSFTPEQSLDPSQLVQSNIEQVAIPPTANNNVNGNAAINIDLGQPGRTGELNRSQDGSLLSFNGNDGAVGVAGSGNGASQKTIAVVGIDPTLNNINTTTWTTMDSGDESRGSVVTSTGTIYSWGHQPTGGVNYFLGTGTATGNVGVASPIAAEIENGGIAAHSNATSGDIMFNGRLYWTEAASTESYPVAGVYTSAVGALPTTFEATSGAITAVSAAATTTTITSPWGVTGTIVTITTPLASSAVENQEITVSGLGGTGYTGAFIITAVNAAAGTISYMDTKTLTGSPTTGTAVLGDILIVAVNTSAPAGSMSLENINAKLGDVWFADMDASGTLSVGDRIYYADNGTTQSGTSGVFVSTLTGFDAAGTAQWTIPINLGDGPSPSLTASGVSQVNHLIGAVVSPTEVDIYATNNDSTAGDVTTLFKMDDVLPSQGATGSTDTVTDTLLQAVQNGTQGNPTEELRGVSFAPVGPTTSVLSATYTNGGADILLTDTLSTTSSGAPTGFVGLLENGTVVQYQGTATLTPVSGNPNESRATYVIPTVAGATFQAVYDSGTFAQATSNTVNTPAPALAGLPVVNASAAALTVLSATGNGTTATITTAMPHGFWVGELVTLKGTTPGGPGGLAGTVTVTGVPSATSFQFTSTYNGTQTLTGATVFASLAGVQRSMVDSIVYNFTEAVNLTAAAFTITAIQNNPGSTVGVVPTVNVAAVPFTNEWVVTFTSPVGGSVVGNSIANGAYTIAINPALVTAVSDGQNLAAGETDTFYRLYGDVTGVQSVKNVDANAFNRAWGNFNYSTGFNAALDYNDDGKFTNIDANAFNRAFNTRYSVTTTI